MFFFLFSGKQSIFKKSIGFIDVVQRTMICWTESGGCSEFVESKNHVNMNSQNVLSDFIDFSSLIIGFMKCFSGQLNCNEQ